jgi:hypothetical protein
MQQIYMVTHSFFRGREEKAQPVSNLLSIWAVYCCHRIEAGQSSEEWHIAVSPSPSKMRVVLKNLFCGYLLPRPEW